MRNPTASIPNSSNSSNLSIDNSISKRILNRLLFQSFFFIVFLQFISNLLIPDHQADAFRSIISPPISSIDYWIREFFVGLSRWDGQHFLHIAQYGYTFEHSLAFFPLFPYLIRSIASIWSPFVPFALVSFPTALLVTAVVTNLGAFYGATWSLYLLTRNFFAIGSAVDRSNSTNSPSKRSSNNSSSNFALLTSIFFVLNPANIFFRAAYTESLYAFLTFFGLNCLYWKLRSNSSTNTSTAKPGRNLLESSICFGLALTVRSNGILNLGYLAFYYGAYWMRPFFNNGNGGAATPRPIATSTPIVQHRQISSHLHRLRSSFTIRRHLKDACGTMPVFLLAIVACLAPFVLAQYYQYELFCSREKSAQFQIPLEIVRMAKEENYVLPGDSKNLQWCSRSGDVENGTSWLDLARNLPYTRVQGKYWRVGLLGYYEWRKLPNFVLATPAFVVALMACVHFLTEMQLSRGDLIWRLLDPNGFLPFILHVVVLSTVGAAFINVEVFTRMLMSSSPLVYWYVASLWVEKAGNLNSGVSTDDDGKTTKNGSLISELDDKGLWGIVKYLWTNSGGSGRLILIWFLGYSVVGTVAFANFLPWT